MPAKKAVQTELDPTTYARLKRLADRKSLSLGAIMREALKSYLESEEGELENDPIFRFIGRLELEGRNWSERKDWRP